MWLAPPTSIEDILIEVQIKFALRQSQQDSVQTGKGSASGKAGGALCTKCNTRKCNLACGGAVKLCSQCCKSGGGCAVHRVSSRDLTPSQLMGTSSSQSAGGTLGAVAAVDGGPDAVPPLQHYARALDPRWATAYVEPHVERSQMSFGSHGDFQCRSGKR